MADVKWIKIVTDIFDDEKILLIESLPDADSIIVIWFKLLCLAGKKNNAGVFQLGSMPYTDEMFSTIFRRPLSTVRLALDTFESFGMVEIINNTVTIPNWEKHQSLEKMEDIKSQNAERQKRFRERKKEELLSGSVTDNVTRNVTVTLRNATDKIRQEGDLNILSDESISACARKYGEFQNVILSDEELAKIKAEYPADWSNRINQLSAYMASTGKKYKSHYATIRSWARRDAEKPKSGYGGKTETSSPASYDIAAATERMNTTVPKYQKKGASG